jgi:N utilization substance protein A
MQIVVPDDQLSLAIGRRGQNVRLAAELTGWRIDISSETKVAEERERAGASLSRVEGLTEFQIQTLYNHGFRSAADVANADDALLGSLPGIEKEQITRLKDSARAVVALEKQETNQAHDVAKDDAKTMMVYDALEEKLVSAGQEERLALSSLDLDESVSKQLLDASYLDIGDIYFDEAEHIAEASGLGLEQIQIIRTKAKKALSELSSGAL